MDARPGLRFAPRLPGRRLLDGFVAMLVVGALAACGEADEAAVTDDETVTAPEAQADQPNARGTVTDIPDDANLVRVYLEDYRIDMPSTLPAGPTRFEIVSRSQDEAHSFEIEGEGIEAALEAHVEGGETQQLYADLAPGTYRVYCPVENHAERGMSMPVTVTETVGAESAPAVR